MKSILLCLCPFLPSLCRRARARLFLLWFSYMIIIIWRTMRISVCCIENVFLREKKRDSPHFFQCASLLLSIVSALYAWKYFFFRCQYSMLSSYGWKKAKLCEKEQRKQRKTWETRTKQLMCISQDKKFFLYVYIVSHAITTKEAMLSMY